MCIYIYIYIYIYIACCLGGKRDSTTTGVCERNSPVGRTFIYIATANPQIFEPCNPYYYPQIFEHCQTFIYIYIYIYMRALQSLSYIATAILNQYTYIYIYIYVSINVNRVFVIGDINQFDEILQSLSI